MSSSYIGPARLGLDVYFRGFVFFLPRANLLYIFGVFCVFSTVYFELSLCQYQCKWLPGKTRLRNDLLRVELDVKLYSLAQNEHVADMSVVTWDRGHAETVI